MQWPGRCRGSAASHFLPLHLPPTPVPPHSHTARSSSSPGAVPPRLDCSLRTPHWHPDTLTPTCRSSGQPRVRLWPVPPVRTLEPLPGWTHTLRAALRGRSLAYICRSGKASSSTDCPPSCTSDPSRPVSRFGLASAAPGPQLPAVRPLADRPFFFSVCSGLHHRCCR